MNSSSMLKVLIIGEDEKLNASLKNYGYGVFSIPNNVLELQNALAVFHPDVVLITIEAKRSDESLRLGEFLHQLGSIPFMYLSSHVKDSLLFKALKTHPHGYHVKPYDIESLYTSIECAFYCFKKGQKYQTTIHQLRSEYEYMKKRAFNLKSNTSKIKICDCYQYKLENYSLLYHNLEIKMTKKERSLIMLLVAELGTIVDFERILSFVWGDATMTYNDVRTLVWRFNKKIPQPIIQNASGIGYYIESARA
ncbi:transcriptional regulator domain-containing protein (plasmid) [Sulfuricurvum kujiense DSM 16994]|uniref:Transcriptional regulator domain-containing protein n=1 Tax=Sulfuricurvum kujiense (strain ATCC BAA-921 / DSM 16994 / JCM 11577 / YK-1) TaxID=709032 RepID=E4U3F8_SULKY|nr:winged helix-turn-helix domain-containing protein [Sulfuricurvum kujiense]ADR35224.1 transcriptional regulator domain-containing protein [Sulfuricurvum kujiense DSM 16994]